MVKKDDWRLLNDVEHLKGKALNPTDGEDITKYAKHLKRCIFCLEEVKAISHQRWFIPEDLSCCVCEECYSDFRKTFNLKELDGYDIEWGQKNVNPIDGS